MPDPTRREFLGVTAAAAACACAGCPLLGAAAAAWGAGPVDVGPVGTFDKDGITDGWSNQGFFIVRRGKRLYAVSSTCTHKKVGLIRDKNDDGFKCPRHGSHFDPAGRVIKSPARKPLPRFAIRLDDRRHVIVERSRRFEEGDWEAAGASVDLQNTAPAAR
jgi:cytochrome b6-f complex iron-sulfur subunit